MCTIVFSVPKYIDLRCAPGLDRFLGEVMGFPRVLLYLLWVLGIPDVVEVGVGVWAAGMKLPLQIVVMCGYTREQARMTQLWVQGLKYCI